MKTGGGASAPLPFFAASICGGCPKNGTQDMVSVPAWLASVARGQGPGSAAIVPCSLRCARDLKGVRPCLAASRLRLNPVSAPAGASRGAARSGGARLPRPARPALASRPLRGSPLCTCACWAALSLSPVAPVLRLRASPARVVAARPARPPRRALSRLSLPPGGCAALGLSPSLAALCGVPPPGVGLFCGWCGGAPAGAGLRTPRPPGAGGQGHIQKHHLSPILYLYFGGDMLQSEK